MTRLFQMQPGDVFSTEKLRNGLKNLTKLYSHFGYIDYVGEPEIDIEPNTNKIDLTLNVDEGKQFFVRRIDFTGNTTTRDKVIRRELLIDEGDIYNSQPLGRQHPAPQSARLFRSAEGKRSPTTLNRNPGTNTVDITLKVKERGKNSISLNGGVSGISGTFVGLNYSTNNFLGLGETLSLGGAGRHPDRQRDARLHRALSVRPAAAGRHHGLSQPLRLQPGPADFAARGRQNVTSFYNSLGSANVLNYIQDSKGITLLHQLSDQAQFRAPRAFPRLRHFEHQDRVARARPLTSLI